MAEENNVNLGADNGVAESQNQDMNQGEREQSEQKKDGITYTKEELDKLLTSEADKRVAQALKTFKEKELPELRKQAQTEAEKLAKMTAEQKAEHDKLEAEKGLKQREEDLVRREFEANKRELKVQVLETLAQKGLPPELADVVNYTDAESCNATIEAIDIAFKEAVKKSMNEALKQKTPETHVNNSQSTAVFPFNFQTVRPMPK